MYCTHCGEQLIEDARFCHACGKSQPIKEQSNSEINEDSYNNNQGNNDNFSSPTGYDEKSSHYSEAFPLNSTSLGTGTSDGYSDSNYTDSENEALKIFIGQKWDYYFRKWDLNTGIPRLVSWNWAAFFLSIYWAGYRKMYGLMGMTLLAWIVLDVVSNISGLSPFVIGIIPAVIYGLFGNYMYYKSAQKKLNKYRSKDGEYPKHQLAIAGGTSGVGIFISIMLVIVYGIIAGTIYVVSNFEELFSNDSNFFDDDSFFSGDFGWGSGYIQFGLGEENGYITSSTNEFSTLDIVYFSFDFPDGRGGDYQVIIEKVEGTNYIYDSWYDTVPPDWPGVVTSLPAPMEEGEFVIKIVKSDEVIARGTFYVDDGFDNIEEF